MMKPLASLPSRPRKVSSFSEKKEETKPELPEVLAVRRKGVHSLPSKRAEEQVVVSRVSAPVTRRMWLSLRKGLDLWFLESLRTWMFSISELFLRAPSGIC